MSCRYCEYYEAKLLDVNGTLSELSGLPGRWAHANTDGYWRCLNPPSEDAGQEAYLFADEMIEQGLAQECDDDECEGRLVIDGECTWCGKVYPKDE